MKCHHCKEEIGNYHLYSPCPVCGKYQIDLFDPNKKYIIACHRKAGKAHKMGDEFRQAQKLK